MNFISIGLRRFFLILVTVVTLGTESAEATWSVIIGDTTTGELAAGSVTCLNGDLLAMTPMVLTGIGIGIVQGNSDPRGIIRPAMREAFLNGASAQEVLDAMMEFGGGNRRQFGICSAESCVSWTGGGTGDWSGGMAGQNGNIVYAIQGNVLAGGCVVTGMLQAIRDNAGEDIPDILMAAMEAARSNGGDGRCSCGASRTDCGCPVEPEPDRTGIIGYMLVTRAGDSDDPICNADGCADGDYFMKINVTADASGPDPVLIMQQMFSNWRSGLIGQPDAVHSYVTIAPDGNNYLMTVYVQDWAGTAVGGVDLVVAHAANSDQVNDIGVPHPVGTGVFEVQLTPLDGETGNDVFQITVQKGSSSVILMPNAQVSIGGQEIIFTDGFESGSEAALFERNYKFFGQAEIVLNFARINQAQYLNTGGSCPSRNSQLSAVCFEAISSAVER